MQAPIRRTGSTERDAAEDGPTPLKRGRTTQEMLADRRGPGFVRTLLRTLAGLAVVAVLLAGLYFGASALEDDKVERAPWAAESTPDAKPATLDDQ